MKQLKRWLKNIRWLFNHPCTNLVNTETPADCSYCGKPSVWNFTDEGGFAVCVKCMKEIFDNGLAYKKK